MKEDNKLLDAVIDLGVGMKELRDEMKGMRKDMSHYQQETNKRLENLEKQQIKTNLALGEMRLSYMRLDGKVSKLDEKVSKLDEKVSNMDEKVSKLDEKVSNMDENVNARITKLDENINGLRSDFNKYAPRNDERANGHEKRIIRLENTTFGKDAQKISMVKEPNAEYKKKKNK